MMSVVCVYNDINKINKILLKYLNNQTNDYELILIDNTKNKYKSASEALNIGGKKANSKYIMFIHQDVKLCSENFLNDVELILDSLYKPGVVGIAGVESLLTLIKNKSLRGVLGNLDHGIPLKPVSKHVIDQPTEVQTVDECLFIIPKKLFNKINFDDECCYDWHLYAADFCLSSEKLGYKTYILPLYIQHISNGNSTLEEYFNTLKLLLIKHRSYFIIRTVFGNYFTIFPLSLQINLKSFFYKIFNRFL